MAESIAAVPNRNTLADCGGGPQCLGSLKENEARNQRIEKEEASGGLSKQKREIIVNLIRCQVVKGRMISRLVVLAHSAGQPLVQFRATVKKVSEGSLTGGTTVSVMGGPVASRPK